MNFLRGTGRFFSKAAGFIRETRAELRKVVWPSWAQVRVYTLVVVFAIVAIGAILWGTDGLLSFGLGKVLGE